VQHLRWIIGTATGLLAGASATAIAPSGSLGTLYVRARAAEAAGDTHTANAGFASLMTQEPANAMIATRAYRQAIAAGDTDLALRAAHALDAQKALPPDARALLVIEQIRAANWVKARAAADRLGQDRVFGFLAPYFQAWIAFGSGTGDPLALAEGGRNLPLAAPYYDEQRAFLLIALGRTQEAAVAAAAQPSIRLPANISGPDEGLSLLLVHVASDFARQRLTPIGLIMARIAAYAAPREAGSWLLLADLLRTMQRPDLAIGALDHVDARDPLGPSARAMRIGLLNDAGRRDAALAEALAATKRDGARAEDWARVGDLYLVMTRPTDAAAAYAEAVKAAEAANVSADALWPLLLQQGGALDQAGDWPGAKAALKRAYGLAPEQAIVLNQYGYSQIEHHEDVEHASAMIEQASKLRPDDPAITDSLGWVFYLRGKADEAAPLLERAAAGDPGEPTINEHLGDVYWALGRQYEARYAWRAALITAADKDRARLTAKIDTGPNEATAAP
jgi:Flp pilus assembly protein TadD